MTEQSTARNYRIQTERDLSTRGRLGRGDFVASVLGMLTALGMMALLGALFTAGIAGIELQTNLLTPEGTLDEVEIAGAIAALAVVFVSFLIGGIAAGRISRYDGGLNGIGAGLWFLLLVAVFAGLGAWIGDEFNVFAGVDLPNWVAQIDADEVTTAAIVMSIASVVVMFAGGYLGGRIGEAHHRKVDAAILDQTVR